MESFGVFLPYAQLCALGAVVWAFTYMLRAMTRASHDDREMYREELAGERAVFREAVGDVVDQMKSFDTRLDKIEAHVIKG